jgi:hypothetical protein
MYQESRRGFGGLVVVCVLVFIGLAVWWLESRFGANVALMVLGGALGVICFTAGALLISANTKAVLGNAAQFNHDLANTERYRQMSGREYARGEREAFSARAKLDLLDAKRIDAIAQQRAGLLVDVERQKMEQRQPRWEVDDTGAFSEWE